ncbi:cobyric acid synthase [Paenibacillus silvae]|jgi:adenosylcobyric acid synthase|uniref:cobyric acid synthase n=1 Tax=Paenibacillus TaxID=44249 RepID=UPI003CF5CB3C
MQTGGSSVQEKQKQPAAVLMLQGTASDVGKSVITTALCRIFKQDGFRPAPFKSQNMALNSYVTADGKEIGRAQGAQAEACGIEATTDMNPILIKPVRDMHSQIVVHGVPFAQMSASDYRQHFLPEARQTVMDALNRLRDAYDIVLMEGAGSPAEINLKDRDIVNMNLAGWADAPVILISDIDRGGVFASIVGTLELLEPHEAARVKGFIINKFRGDLSLLQPGLDWLEERTGIPVLGVLPYIRDIQIEAEDSVVLDSLRHGKSGQTELDIAVIRYPRISNFTDFDALLREPDVNVRYVTSPEELGRPDAVILPGTKDTIGDLIFLRESGLERAILNDVEQKAMQLVGICGGYQMLGRHLKDPFAVEANQIQEAEGIGLLPLSTTFLQHKQTVRAAGKVQPFHPFRLSGMTNSDINTEQEAHTSTASVPVNGYEIHMGVTECHEPEQVTALFEIAHAGGEPFPEGWGTSDGSVWGTYLHGLFESDRFRRSWLNGLREAKGLPPLEETYSAHERKEMEFDRVADSLRSSLDMKRVYEIMGVMQRE